MDSNADLTNAISTSDSPIPPNKIQHEHISTDEEAFVNSRTSPFNDIKRKYEGVQPFEGMAFESLEEAHCYYHIYAQVSGFNVRIRTNSTFPRSSEIRYRRYVCSCAGHCSEKKIEVAGDKKEKKTLTSRKDCTTAFVVSRKKDTNHWVGTHVNNVHTHVLVSPRSAQNLRNQKVMPSIVKRLVEKFSEVGLPTGRVPDILNKEPSVNLSRRFLSGYNGCNG